mmetsp:Transcript_2843/g.6869  ORF Transcript_2843/g.6869 Transcript_2843/m.6869 type:complete len:388 (+) Transcript_2843:92-1255(+)
MEPRRSIPRRPLREVKVKAFGVDEEMFDKKDGKFSSPWSMLRRRLSQRRREAGASDVVSVVPPDVSVMRDLALLIQDDSKQKEDVMKLVMMLSNKPERLSRAAGASSRKSTLSSRLKSKASGTQELSTKILGQRMCQAGFERSLMKVKRGQKGKRIGRTRSSNAPIFSIPSTIIIDGSKQKRSEKGSRASRPIDVPASQGARGGSQPKSFVVTPAQVEKLRNLRNSKCMKEVIHLTEALKDALTSQRLNDALMILLYLNTIPLTHEMMQISQLGSHLVDAWHLGKNNLNAVSHDPTAEVAQLQHQLLQNVAEEMLFKLKSIVESSARAICSREQPRAFDLLDTLLSDASMSQRQMVVKPEELIEKDANKAAVEMPTEKWKELLNGSS